MNLNDTIALVRSTATRMNELYTQPVFDELALVSAIQGKVVLLWYEGPRREDFIKNFMSDTHDLRVQLRAGEYGVGDFEFARHGTGTSAEAFVVVGEGLYLICNHTGRSMHQIAASPLWLKAQLPFVELSDRVRSTPLIHPL